MQKESVLAQSEILFENFIWGTKEKDKLVHPRQMAAGVRFEFMTSTMTFV